MLAAPPAQTVVISFETGLHCCTLPHSMLSEAIGSARSGPSKPLCRTSHFKPLDKKHGTTCCASHQHAVCSMQMMFGKKTCSCKLRERDNLRLPDMGKTLTPCMRPSWYLQDCGYAACQAARPLGDETIHGHSKHGTKPALASSLQAARYILCVLLQKVHGAGASCKSA